MNWMKLKWIEWNWNELNEIKMNWMKLKWIEWNWNELNEIEMNWKWNVHLAFEKDGLKSRFLPHFLDEALFALDDKGGIRNFNRDEAFPWFFLHFFNNCSAEWKKKKSELGNTKHEPNVSTSFCAMATTHK